MKPSPRVVVPVVLLAAAALLWWMYGRSGSSHALTASGTIEATESQLGFATGGQIVALPVQEGQLVKAGTLLGALDSAETLARVAQWSAQAGAARAQLIELQRGSRTEEIAQARAQVVAADQTAADAARDLARIKGLADRDLVSRQSLDQAQVTSDVAAARLDQARAQLSLVEAGPRPEKIAAQRAQVISAEAQLRAAEAAAGHLRLYAPGDGIITIRYHEPGETVGPGVPVVALLDPSDRWVRIYVPENRIGQVSLGERATIRSDSWPDSTFAGEVEFISPQAEFTPRNVQTTEERVRLVYAVKVRITGDSGLRLKPGTPADVALEGGKAGRRAGGQ
jgi:membrane fusion protein YbhG